MKCNPVIALDYVSDDQGYRIIDLFCFVFEQRNHAIS